MSKQHITTTINGNEVEFLCETQQTLLDVLRNDLGMTGTKEGCATGDCGACTVTLDGRMVCSCLVLGVEAEGKAIQTIEGMAQGDKLHVRHLHAGLPGGCARIAREQPDPHRRRSAILARRQSLPLHRLQQNHRGGA